MASSQSSWLENTLALKYTTAPARLAPEAPAAPQPAARDNATERLMSTASDLMKTLRNMPPPALAPAKPVPMSTTEADPPARKADAEKRKKKTTKKAESVDEESSRGNSDEDESFIDNDDSGEGFALIKPTFYSTKRAKARERRREAKRRARAQALGAPVRSSAEDDDDDGDDEAEEDERVVHEKEKERFRGLELTYGDDEFVELADSSVSSDGDDDDDASCPSLSLPSSSSSGSDNDDDDRVAGDDDDEDGSGDDGKDDVEEIAAYTRHIVARPPAASETKRRLRKNQLQARDTKRSRAAREALRELVPAADVDALVVAGGAVDSEASTVDTAPVAVTTTTEAAPAAGEEPADTSVSRLAQAKQNTAACLQKIFERADARLPNGTPLPLPEVDVPAHVDAMVTLSHILMNACVEQQTSKNIQTSINLGKTHVAGSTAARKQSEVVQEHLTFLAHFTHAAAMLDLLSAQVQEQH